MTPRDRLLTTLRGGTADRVPLVLLNARRLDDFRDPIRRQIAARIIDQTHFQVGFNSHVNRYLVTPPQRIREVAREESGGTVTATSEIDTPKGTLTAIVARNTQTDTEWTVKYPVESLADIERIRSVPWELPAGLAAPDLWNLPAEFATRGIVASGVSSPMVCVGGMMRYERYLELCAAEFDLVRELTQQCFERIMSVLDVLLAKRNVEYMWMGGCEWLTPPMGSPRLHDELVQRFEKPLIARMHAAGALCHVHCHGKVRSTIEKVIERGADFFEPVEPPPNGDLTFAEAKAIAAGRITLGGNLEARIVENENIDAVERSVRAAFEGGKHRMVLQLSAGPIGPITPRMAGNYNRIIDLWEEMAPMQGDGPGARRASAHR